MILLLENWDLILSFFAIAILYASVGFGGGSSYLAILALSSLNYSEIRATALVCNIIVVAGSFILYFKEGLYNFKKVLPLVMFSIPMAFLGGYLKLQEKIFYVLLGMCLLTAGITMLLRRKEVLDTPQKQNTPLKDTCIGGSIGFLSGLVGIGGGIFLAPFLHISKWDTSKKIAATATLFILVNSVAGLTGQLLNPTFNLNIQLTLILAITTGIGGQIGTRLSIKIISPRNLKIATAILIIYVAVRLLLKNL